MIAPLTQDRSLIIVEDIFWTTALCNNSNLVLFAWHFMTFPNLIRIAYKRGFELMCQKYRWASVWGHHVQAHFVAKGRVIIWILFYTFVCFHMVRGKKFTFQLLLWLVTHAAVGGPWDPKTSEHKSPWEKKLTKIYGLQESQAEEKIGEIEIIQRRK